MTSFNLLSGLVPTVSSVSVDCWVEYLQVCFAAFSKAIGTTVLFVTREGVTKAEADAVNAAQRMEMDEYFIVFGLLYINIMLRWSEIYSV